MGAASSPERFVRAAVQALPAAVRDARAARRRAHPRPRRGRQAARRRRRARAVRPLVDARRGGRPPGGAAPRRGHRDPLARLLRRACATSTAPSWPRSAARPRGTVLATSMPTAARRLWPALSAAAPRADRRPRAGVGAVRGGHRRRCGTAGPGRLRAARATWTSCSTPCAAAATSSAAWAAAWRAGGRLERLCRHTYETLLLRSRGYGMSKAVLGAVAEEEGLNLTALVGRLGRSPGAIRDYLGWLLGRRRAAHGGQALLLRRRPRALVGAPARRRRHPHRRAARRGRARGHGRGARARSPALACRAPATSG